jgi:ribosomal protein S18 acetylase RimI-like enzyme
MSDNKPLDNINDSSQSHLKIKTKSIFQSEFSTLGTVQFKRKQKNDKEAETVEDDVINVDVYCLRLNRLIETKNKATCSKLKRIFNIKRRRDIVHSLCALLDRSLPDIGAESIYDCICKPRAFTICLLKSINNDKVVSEDDNNSCNSSIYEDSDCLDTIEEQQPDIEPIFHSIFSDASSSEDEDTENDDTDEEEEEEDYSLGLKTFLEQNRNEKCQFLKRIIGCSSFERSNSFHMGGNDECVISLDLMCIRSKYRGYNLGKYLIRFIQNTTLMGKFDAIVTSSDVGAIEFYEKFGFTQNPLLNSKYNDIGDNWTNTTKMCFISPYTTKNSKFV